jgi:hypothetical protein
VYGDVSKNTFRGINLPWDHRILAIAANGTAVVVGAHQPDRPARRTIPGADDRFR